MTQLKRILTPFMVWGLGVGYVISGNYFGWNLGLSEGGSLGLAIATIAAIILYVTFTYSYAELACAIPKAGGAFDYANRGLGPDLGFIAGMAQNIEFVFAPPAIALGVGSYVALFVPGIHPLVVSIFVYVLVTAINMMGIKVAATFELVVTLVAVGGLLLFAGVGLPQVSWEHLARNPLPHGLSGIFAAAPYAIWFFLGIEGVANLAEETIDPNKTMSRGFLAALFTLITVCALTFVSSVGVGGWEAVVFLPDGSTTDAPLPAAMQMLVGKSHVLNTIMIAVGLFGLAASLNGLVLAAGRSTYEFGKLTAPGSFIGKIEPRFQSPAGALAANLGVGLVALLTGRTGEVITISVLGALTLYIVSMIAMIRLRLREPGLLRPFVSPAFPYFPLIAMFLSAVAWVSVALHNFVLCLIYVLLLAVCFGIFKFRILRHP